jgi:hypothetical protein
MTLPYTSKTVTFSAQTGKDQLGNVIGKPQLGDVAQIHLDASYTSVRPFFRLGFIKLGLKERKKDFLSTHIIGDTAFFDLEMTKSVMADPPAEPKNFDELLAICARSMVLGEAATFVLDFSEQQQPYVKGLVVKAGRLHKGHFANVPDTALTMTLKIDSFRIQRRQEENDGKRKSHYRVSRNGMGGSMPGSFGM